MAEQEKELIEAGWTKIETGVSTMYTRPVSPEVWEIYELIQKAKLKDVKESKED